MIYVTGDMHGFYDFKKLEQFASRFNELTKEDYVIVCGDFGLVWNWTETGECVETNKDDTKWTTNELYQKNLIEKFPFTTLFVDGITRILIG